jgi:hypothetical protein
MKEIQDLWVQRNHTSWTKCRQLPVVWRRIEKDFTTAEIQKQRLFYQLLEMTAVSFPK